MWNISSLTVDDAYISYRYAQNLVEGHGLVYNPGEYVEGYTNFLWTLLLAAGIKLGIGAELFSKLMGACFALGSLYFIYRLSHLISALRMAPTIATWLVAGNLVFMGYAIQGLESAMFVFLLLAGTKRFFDEEDQNLSVYGSALLFATAGLTRPEAPMYLGLLMLLMPGVSVFQGTRLTVTTNSATRPAYLLAVICWLIIVIALALVVSADPARIISTGLNASIVSVIIGLPLIASCAVLLLLLPRSLFHSRNIIRGLVFTAPLLAHALWRHEYYGDWLPNTLGAKTGNIIAQLYAGTHYLKSYWLHDGFLILPLIFGVVAAFVEKNRYLLALASLTTVACAYVVLVGGDWMPLHRFMLPIIPFYVLIADVILRRLLDSRERLLQTCTGVFLVIVALQMYSQYRNDLGSFKTEEARWDKHAKNTAQWFIDREQQYGKAQVEGTIALGDIGEVGFKTNYPILDLLGLVNPTIANLPGGYTKKTGEGFRQHFFARRPRYAIIISNQYSCQRATVSNSQALLQDHRFLRQYTVTDRVWAGGDFFWCIYEDREKTLPQSPAADVPFSEKQLELLDQSFQVLPNRDLPGANIDVLKFSSQSGLQQYCQRACLNNKNCRAYAHTNDNMPNPQLRGICWLKGDGYKETNNRGVNSGKLK